MFSVPEGVHEVGSSREACQEACEREAGDGDGGGRNKSGPNAGTVEAIAAGAGGGRVLKRLIVVAHCTFHCCGLNDFSFCFFYVNTNTNICDVMYYLLFLYIFLFSFVVFSYEINDFCIKGTYVLFSASCHPQLFTYIMIIKIILIYTCSCTGINCKRINKCSANKGNVY